MDLVVSRQRQRQARRVALAVDRGTRRSSNTVTTSAGILANRATKMANRVGSSALVSAMGSITDASGGLTTRSVAAADIANVAHVVNTTGKRAGLIVYDSTGQRLMVATGSASNAAWNVVDASANVIPA